MNKHLGSRWLRLKYRVAVSTVCLVFAAGGAVAGPDIANSSFEDDAVPGYPGYGTPTAWTASGGVGLNDSTGPFWDNGSTTSGTKCAFIQGIGSFTQDVPGFEAGHSYTFRVRANYRVASALQARLQVTVGTSVVIASTQVTAAGGPAGTGNPFNLYTGDFASPGAGTFPVKLENLETAGDNTLLLDEVEIVPNAAGVRDWGLFR